MIEVRLWKEAPDLRPWASVGVEGRGHLLADFLDSNLLTLDSFDSVMGAAIQAAADVNFEDDLGFFDSAAIYFNAGTAKLDHAISDYGSYVLPAAQLVRVLTEWRKVLLSEGPIECELRIED